MIPVGAAAAALAPLGVGLIYEHGAFGPDATARTAGVVAGLAPLIPLTMAMYVVTGAHNARRRGGIIGTSAVLTAILNLGLNLLLAPVLGVLGIALSTSITSFAVFVFLAWRLSRLESGFTGRELSATWARAVLASAIAAVPIGVLTWSGTFSAQFPAGGAWLALLGVVGGIIYLGVSLVLRLREPVEVLRGIVGALRRSPAQP